MDGSRCSTTLLPSDFDPCFCWTPSQQQPTAASNSGGSSSSSNLAPTTNCHQPLFKAKTAAGAASAAAAAVAILSQRPSAISLSLKVLKTARHPQREFWR